MKIVGVKRKIDKLGRLVLPKPYRDYLKFKLNEEVEILLTDTGVLVKKIYPVCVFCGNTENLFAIQHNYICKYCAEEVERNELVY